jgi:hypothetical protein
MERDTKRKMLVGLLTVLLALPYTIQSTHIHSFDTATATADSSHDCNNCPICQFSFSSFTEAEALVYAPLLSPSTFIPAIPQDKPYISHYLSPTLRAPPFFS